MKKILILASNPRKDLNLDDEIRLLRDVVDRSRDRDQFEIVSEPGVRVGDLQGLLLRHQPQIVHFCGHGGGEEGLIFKMDGGGEQWVRADALASMFKLNPICSNVKCVLLNACYSEEQANAIVSGIDYVVGMSHAIQDDAAIAFSKGFYLALGYGCSIEDAFEFGKNAIQLEISGSSKMRSAVSEAQRKAVVENVVATTEIPEHLKPILKKRSTLTLEASPNTLSRETKVEIQLGIDKSLEEDSKVKQYREQVREYLSDRKLEDYEKIFLNVLRDELGLSPEEANKIQEEELAPIRQDRQAYETRLNALITFYPFSDPIKSELKKFQAQRNLTDEEVEEISRPILEQAEIAHQEKRRQEAQQAYENKRHRYEREFLRAISAGYPIEDLVRSGLRNFQHSLGLSDGDIERIEQPIIAPKEVAYQQELAEAQRQREQEEEKARERSQQREALERQQREEAERKRVQEEAAKREQQRQLELERQRLEEERRERMKTTQGKSLQSFEFDVITVDKKGNENSRTRKSAESFAENLGNGVSLDMVRIPGGTFPMGSPAGQGDDDERPQHSVTLPSFFMGKYPITQAQWRAVAALSQVEIPLDPEPSYFKGDTRPVEQVSWHESVEFCQRVSRLTGHPYRLPSEAEWEYACRSVISEQLSVTSEEASQNPSYPPFYFGETITGELANYNASYTYADEPKGKERGETTPVGQFPPNAFGLYDMHGNVWEWCADCWHDNYVNAPTDGSAWITGRDSLRVRRGGSWSLHPAFCRSASRSLKSPADRRNDIGFRVVCGLFPGLF